MFGVFCKKRLLWTRFRMIEKRYKKFSCNVYKRVRFMATKTLNYSALISFKNLK